MTQLSIINSKELKEKNLNIKYRIVMTTVKAAANLNIMFIIGLC